MVPQVNAVVAAGVGMAVMLTALPGSWLFAGQQTDPAHIISQPAEWVAHTYDFRMRESDGDELSYTLHQSSDGSTRRDRTDGPEIHITNRQRGKYYRYARVQAVVAGAPGLDLSFYRTGIGCGSYDLLP